MKHVWTDSRYAAGKSGDGACRSDGECTCISRFLQALGDIYTVSVNTVGDLRLSYLRARTPVTPANPNVDLSQFGPFWAGISSISHTGNFLPRLS